MANGPGRDEEPKGVDLSEVDPTDLEEDPPIPPPVEKPPEAG